MIAGAMASSLESRSSMSWISGTMLSAEGIGGCAAATFTTGIGRLGGAGGCGATRDIICVTLLGSTSCVKAMLVSFACTLPE